MAPVRMAVSGTVAHGHYSVTLSVGVRMWFLFSKEEVRLAVVTDGIVWA